MQLQLGVEDVDHRRQSLEENIGDEAAEMSRHRLSKPRFVIVRK